MTRRLLIVDDDPAILESLADALDGGSATVRTARSAEEAIELLAPFEPEVILSDLKMPGMDGLGLLELVRERLPGVDVVLMTAYEDMPTVVRAMRGGAADFLVKPLDLDEILDVLDRLFEAQTLREREARERDREASEYRLDALVGRDPRMIEIYKLIGQLADQRVNVLIRGETGTGKELVARAIHFNSPDYGQPFVAVNCTALAETLLESELFGHVKGSFTGAVSSRRGRFALAGSGTIFLDEIGDTTPEFQAKLLRVLEEGEFYPVGAEHAETTDARVIAATHRELESQVRAGSFREDLYYRLRVVEVAVPPLRERRGDIPLLAEHLVRRAAEKLHAPEPVLHAEAIGALSAHDWPGNVRELDNCLVRAVVLTRGGVIKTRHLAIDGSAPVPADDLPSLEVLEERHVRRVLAATGGEKKRAARILGISRPRLYRLLEKYGLEERKDLAE
ncbi:MAG: sigma-54 dependent transcriptional regulator [Gemmatimonadota bacterium]|nr:sigma-54 dependent transcriptional regulator [Gemmatimonadota bacterium]